MGGQFGFKLMSIEHKTKIEHLLGEPFFADRLFCGLSPKTSETFSCIKQTRRFPKNVFICKSENMPLCLYLLVEGEAQMSLNSNFADQKTVRSVEQHEILGLTENLANLPYRASVRTLSPCIFESIKREDFLEFIYYEPQICLRLLQILGKNYQKLANAAFFQ